MDSREARVKMFHKSVDNLQVWLEQCQKSVSRFPADLHQFDASQLTKLALKYKELLIQLKEKHSYIHEIKSFYSDLEKEEAVHGLAKSDGFFAGGSANGVKSSRTSDRIQRVQVLWTDTCREVKHQYSKLSSALVSLTGRALTPVSNTSTPSPTHSGNKSASPDERELEPAGQKMSRTGPMSIEPREQLNEESLDSILSSLQQEVNQQVASLEQYIANDDDLSSRKPISSHVASKSVPRKPLGVDIVSPSADRSPSHRSKSVSQSSPFKHKLLTNSLSSLPKPSQQNTDHDDAMKELDDFISSFSPPPMQGNSSYRMRSSTSDKANCRLARKLREMTPKLREAENSLDSDAPCPLQAAAIERRMTDYKMSLSIVEEQAKHMRGIQAPSGLQPIYTPVEWECCQEDVSSAQAKVQTLDSALNDVISHYELVLELIQQFENEVSGCHDTLSASRSDVSELRSSVLEGCISNQPWASATKALDSLKSSSDKISLLEKLSKQMLSLQPQFDGTAIHQKMSSLTTELHQLHSEANSTIQNAISHRVKFAEERVAIVDDWLLRVRALIESWVKGEEECTAEIKESVVHEVSDHQSTFGLILEQLQHVQELSSQPDSIKKTHDRIKQRQENLEKLLQQLKGSSHILRSRCKSAGSTPDPMERSSLSRKISPAVPHKSAHVSDSQRKRKTSHDNVVNLSPAPSSPLLPIPDNTSSSGPLSPPPKTVQSPPPPGAKHSRDASTSSSEGSSTSGTHQKEVPIVESSPQAIALLQFIDTEYSSTAEKLGMEDVGILPTEEVGEVLTKFWSALSNLSSTMEAIRDQIYYIGIPTDPSQQHFREKLQLCKAIRSQLDCSNILLSKYHDESPQLVTASSEDQPHHGIVLHTEYQLFKLSTLYHRCRLLLEEKEQVLHQAQEDYGSLYDDLKELSECLEEANQLLIHRDELLDVSQFLLECKEAHLKLARFSTKRQQASSKIRNLLLVSTTSSCKSPPSPSQASRRPSVSSLMLLEQLRSIEMQWVNVINELANMAQLESLLFKRMLRNIAKELKTLDEFSLEVQYQGMDLEILVKKAKLCKDKLKRMRVLQVSLKQAMRRLTHLKALPEDEPVYDHPRSILSPLPVAVENMSKFEVPSPSQSPHESPVHAVHSAGSGSLVAAGVHDSSSPKDDSTQGTIIPKKRTDVGMIRCDSLVNYPQLLQTCKALLDMIEKVISNIESWCNRFDELRRTMDVFWSESNGLRTWMRATCKALAGKDKKISPALTGEIATRRQALLDLHQHTTHVLALQSTAQERDAIKDMISKLDAKWESLCLSLPISMRLNATITVDPISHLRFVDN